jgi:hypothetical protein
MRNEVAGRGSLVEQELGPNLLRVSVRVVPPRNNVAGTAFSPTFAITRGIKHGPAAVDKPLHINLTSHNPNYHSQTLKLQLLSYLL